MVLCLVTICVSYLAIRTRLNYGVSTIDTAHNRPNESQQNAKLSRTLFIVTASSLLFWVSGIAVNSIHFHQ